MALAPDLALAYPPHRQFEPKASGPYTPFRNLPEVSSKYSLFKINVHTNTQREREMDVA